MRSDFTNIGYLEEFVYLAESLSFKQTAEHFYVSRSVITRHIASLEETVGVRLIKRDTRSVELTEAGRVFCRDAQMLLNDWSITLEHMRRAADDIDSVVHVGYLRNAARPILTDFVQWMSEHYPQIRFLLVCMEYNDLRRALEENSIDVAIGVNVHPRFTRNYRSTRVYDDRFSVVCSKAHPLALAHESVTLADLEGQKLLLPDSYVYAGLAEVAESLVDERSLLVAQAYYRDIDMLYLKIQTESCAAFSAGMTNRLFGDRVTVLPIEDADTSFSVSAFYSNEFTGGVCAACQEGFEWCRDELEKRRNDADSMPLQ